MDLFLLFRISIKELLNRRTMSICIRIFLKTHICYPFWVPIPVQPTNLLAKQNLDEDTLLSRPFKNPFSSCQVEGQDSSI